jgi:hypothetical protein
MKAESIEGIKVHLDRALETRTITICILKEGLTEAEHIHTDTALIHRKIEFEPYGYINDFYVGRIFYPNGKSQGIMHFGIDSFESVICLEEA